MPPQPGKGATVRRFKDAVRMVAAAVGVVVLVLMLRKIAAADTKQKGCSDTATSHAIKPVVFLAGYGVPNVMIADIAANKLGKTFGCYLTGQS